MTRTAIICICAAFVCNGQRLPAGLDNLANLLAANDPAAALRAPAGVASTAREYHRSPAVQAVRGRRAGVTPVDTEQLNQYYLPGLQARSQEAAEALAPFFDFAVPDMLKIAELNWPNADREIIADELQYFAPPGLKEEIALYRQTDHHDDGPGSAGTPSKIIGCSEATRICLAEGCPVHLCECLLTNMRQDNAISKLHAVYEGPGGWRMDRIIKDLAALVEDAKQYQFDTFKMLELYWDETGSEAAKKCLDEGFPIYSLEDFLASLESIPNPDADTLDFMDDVLHHINIWKSKTEAFEKVISRYESRKWSIS